MFSVVTILALMLMALPMGSAGAVSTDVVISEFRTRGPNGGSDEFIELYNLSSAAVDISAWKINGSNASGSVSTRVTIMSGTVLGPGCRYLVTNSSTSGGPYSGSVLGDQTYATGIGDDGGIALLRSDNSIVDAVGMSSGSAYKEGTTLTPTTTNMERSYERRPGGGTDNSQDTDNNAADFVLNSGTSNPQNRSAACTGGGGPTNPSGSGAATPNSVFAGDTTLLTVTVTPGSNPPSTGLAVTGDLSAIGGSASQAFFDDATNGDVTAGDNVFSFQATVAAGTSGGAKSLPVSITDTEGRSGNTSIALTVTEILPIGTVQGSVDDSANGLTHMSPYVGQTVVVRGVIYEKTQEFRSAGGAFYGFFLQNTADRDDDDPNSSDGIFVFHDRFPTLLVDGGGSYIPQVGDEVILRGPVQERFNNTRLNNPRLVQVVRSGVILNDEIPAFEVNPQADIEDDIQDAYRYWERHEGMRAQVPANSIVLDGRDVFLSTFDSEVWVARGDSQIAQRSDPYARRSFRDPHPLDDIPAELFDNGNPYRILMGSFGLKATLNDTTALLAPSRTYDVLTNSPVGGVYFNFGKYSVQVEQQIELTPGADPSLNAPPQSFDRSEEFSIAPYNVENLYDFRDDPFDGCDFTGNSGCPGVNPPFDYVPASNAVYQAHLNDLALQIINDLHSPDIIFVQEAEDQDICTVTGGALTCGTTNNADGKPDTLQELTTVIASLDGPAYDAAYDRDGADDRGIVSGFLYRTDRVELLPASEFDPVLGSSPTVDYRGAALEYNSDVQNPKALNADLPSDVDTSTGVDGSNVFTRPPQVALFRVWRTEIGASTFVDMYALSNHFSSTPNARVGQRTEQALYDAAIVEALQVENPDALIAVAGDFNVYPRPDDPFTPGQSLYPSDQLGPLYDQGLLNLFDVLVTEVPVSAYSYVFEGQTQTLDQIFVTPSLMSELVQARAAHVNADWPADYSGDVARGASDHDPLVARYANLPTIDKLEALVQYFADNGMITGNNTARLLIDRLERARRFQENGQRDAYLEQLQAFIDQVNDLTPQFIAQEAADALTTDAALLKSLP
jgi:predicted extracellular nuclease